MRMRLRSKTGLIKRVLLSTLLLTLALPVGEAAAAPTVELLNPSDYMTVMRISDKESADTSFDLVAWVGEVPPNPLVEFELATATTSLATVTGTKVATDTWEGELTIPDTVTDGQYILKAILYRDFVGPGTGTDVATTQEVVQVNAADVPPPPPSETVSMTYPDNGQGLGFFTAPGGRANAVLEGVVSEGTQRVRALYTLSNPGADPEWIACGSGTPNAELGVRARCTLADDGPAARVRAVALVANQTPPPGDPVAAADETGDVHRVVPYAQVPSTINITPESVKTEVDQCRSFEVTVLDQLGSEVAGANVDVHANGPDDQLRFASMAGTSDAFQAPDKSHTGSEPTSKCAQTDADNSQGDHNVPGPGLEGADEKHIESRSGTGNDGGFTFVLKSGIRGGTLIEAWADVDDDDTLAVTEASGGAQVGWGVDPPEPEIQLILDPRVASADSGSCQRFVVAVRQGGNPLASRNVDVHIKDPEGISYCAASGSTGRPPDPDEHGASVHDDGNNHAEGETDSNGQFVFGATSSRDGLTGVVVWIDDDDDDTQDAAERTTTGQVTWGGETRRVATKLTIRYRRGSFKGKVRSSNAQCRRQRTVVLKKVRRGRDKTVGTDTSSRNGSWKVRRRAGRGRYYAQTPKKEFIAGNGDRIVCRADKSSRLNP